MAGFYETQVRRAMLTVGDADVLNEMATGWRASIRDLNTVDDRLKAGINGLRDHDQLGEATRDAAVGAFRDMRGTSSSSGSCSAGPPRRSTSPVVPSPRSSR